MGGREIHREGKNHLTNARINNKEIPWTLMSIRYQHPFNKTGYYLSKKKKKISTCKPETS
jgi:hypothetical protein